MRGLTKRRRWTSAAWIAGVWLFVGLLQATQRYLRGRELEPDAWAAGSALAENLFLAALWAALTPLVMRIARRHPLPGTPVFRLVVVHCAGGAAVAFLHTFVSNVAYKLLVASNVPWDDVLGNTFQSALVTGPTRFATYLQIVGVTWGLDEYRRWREGEIRASALTGQLARERLESLALRLHPAFLFQTLGLLKSTIRRDPKVAARTIVELGELLRLALAGGGRRFVRLDDELRYADLYLKIESTRLERPLPVVVSASREARDAAVPSLVLQPLVEAAVSAARPAPARVDITAERHDGRITLTVRAEPDPSAVSFTRDGASAAAIERARGRLDLEYPGAHRLLWSSVSRQATVDIPYAALELSDAAGAAR